MKTKLDFPAETSLHMDVSLSRSLAANELLNNSRMTRKLYQELTDIKRERAERNAALSGLFLSIGLSLSLLFAIIAMNWRSYEDGDLVDLGRLDADFEQILEVPPSDQPPPPPKADQIMLVEVDDVEAIEELELDFDIEITQETVLQDVVFFNDKIEEEKVDEIFQIVEDRPEPIGGLAAFYRYIGDNMHYPEKAIRLNVSGVVFVKFVVEKDGSLTDINVIKGIGEGCDEEAIRVLQGAPKWKPGKQRGKAVRVYMTVPIRFMLREM